MWYICAMLQCWTEEKKKMCARVCVHMCVCVCVRARALEEEWREKVCVFVSARCVCVCAFVCARERERQRQTLHEITTSVELPQQWNKIPQSRDWVIISNDPIVFSVNTGTGQVSPSEWQFLTGWLRVKKEIARPLEKKCDNSTTVKKSETWLKWIFLMS